MTAIDWVMSWLATGAAVCLALGIPDKDIGHPVHAVVFVSLWPVWILCYIIGKLK